MIDPETGGPHTAHTTNPVPFVLAGGGGVKLRNGGSLRDVGPMVLRELGLDIPREMTGRDLREGA
jgi:2,3-bisphosphoglycerate-independent phosphoglycerate mutase